MSIDYIEKQISEAIGNDSITSVEKGQRFLRWTLSYIFDKSDSEIEENDLNYGVLICDGPNDSGVDAAFIENDTISIIQSKYLNSNSYEAIAGFLYKIKTIIIDGISKESRGCLKDVYNATLDMEGIDIYYVTNDSIMENDWKVISKQVKEVEKAIKDNTQTKRVKIRILDINNIEDFIDESRSIVPKKFQGTQMKLILEKYFENKENNTIIAEVSLKSLASFIKNKENYLFYSNIRNFLGKRNKVNKEIERTYNEDPKKFWFYNNGITIVCDRYYDIKDFGNSGASMMIETPQIVNGCQTSSTIYSLWKNQSKEERINQEGTILVKIIEDINSTKRKKITKYTNSQTAVTGKDFFALEEFHYKLQKDFLKLGYNYIIQRKDRIEKKDRKKGNKKYSYLFDKKFNNAFFAKDIVQAFTAGIHFKPAKAKSISNLVPGGSYYDKLFNDQTTPQDARYYFFPYAIMYYSKNIMNHSKNDKLKSVNLLFINIYFKILLFLFQRLDLVTEDIVDIIHCDKDVIEWIDSIFKNQSLNKKILELTEEITKIFLKDTMIKRKIGDNLPKFLKSNVENDAEVIAVLNDKIREEIEDCDEFNIYDIKACLETSIEESSEV
ncbi:AIPR family protein [Clostridium septicum]|nr:AIPR family protein [Clostridium septicum]MDU1313694.1 AIPR family protein [Clostridium septicum]UEC21605.1 AIPR family protein [Clostridium septicum]USS00346.1 AIPR family protein [Clostridium septicum]WLF68897.1 AIPR family protein [Clostridium septicum]